jgi:hypothetical protein
VSLQELADELGLRLFVCHFPPGTSKWNKIEHRLFSFITQNWRGKPLVNHNTIVNLIASTTTRTGLIVKAALDTNHYETKIKVPDEQLSRLRLKRHPILFTLAGPVSRQERERTGSIEGGTLPPYPHERRAWVETTWSAAG